MVQSPHLNNRPCNITVLLWDIMVNDNKGADMTYKLNNKATVIFKDGTISEIECSYVSYSKNSISNSNPLAYETVKFHGLRGVPVTVINMSEISRLTVTDNPVEYLESPEEFAEAAFG